MPVRACTSRVRAAASIGIEAVDAGVEVDVFGDSEVFVEAEFLRHVADVAADLGGVFADVHAKDAAGAFRWAQQVRRAP